MSPHTPHLSGPLNREVPCSGSTCPSFSFSMLSSTFSTVTFFPTAPLESLSQGYESLHVIKSKLASQFRPALAVLSPRHWEKLSPPGLLASPSNKDLELNLPRMEITSPAATKASPLWVFTILVNRTKIHIKWKFLKVLTCPQLCTVFLYHTFNPLLGSCLHLQT